MSLEPAKTQASVRFGDDFELDFGAGQLRRSGRILKLERIPMEVLLYLVQHRGELVTRERMVERVWGKNAYLDTDNSINGAIRKIRHALKDDSEQPRFIQTITGKGYRFIAPVVDPAVMNPGAEPKSAIAAPQSSGREDSTVRSTRPRWPVVLVASVVGTMIVMITAVGVYFRWSETQARPQRPDGRTMLAVLPFENFTGDAGQEYFSDGLTEEMISQLGDLDPGHLGVIARTSVMHYKHSQESIPQIGRDLGVQYVIEGSVRRDSERVRITAQLIQVKDQSHLWARQYDRDLDHLLELQAEIAREVANEIEFSLSGRRPIEAAQKATAPASGANSYEAYDLYLKGRYFWNKRTAEGFRQAVDYFQRAIDKDPNFGRAYAGLADTFSLMSTWYMGPQNELMPKARSAALRALELDESLAEAHASLALIRENYDYDWPGAEKEFRRAIQLDSQYATAHQWYAEFLSWQGRFDEAFAESARARRLDPLSLIIASDYASILYDSREYESALKQCRSVLELDPNYDHARISMIPSYVQLGRYDEAIDGINRWPNSGEAWAWAWKAAIYSRSGHVEEARQALAKLEQVSGSRADRNAMWLVAYSGTGQKERLIELLQKAYSERSNAVVDIKVDPMYDPIRSDPRFEDLLGRVGFER